MTGYKASVYTQDGTPLPQQYLHHILMMNNAVKSVTCPGEPLFFAGAGMEMTEARFPPGYGVKLGKGDKLMALVAFYHKVPPTKDVMASFTQFENQFLLQGVPAVISAHSHDRVATG